MTNRIVVALIGMTLIMQAAILYRQESRRPSPGPGVAVREARGGASMELVGLPMQGSKDAKLVLVEFSDYECPYCARHASSVALELNRDFVETGKVQHVFANNPLPAHASAKLLATAAICAGRQNRYWRMHDELFRIKPRTKDEILALSADIGLDAAEFQQCLDQSPGVAARIDQDISKAKEFELMGTPSFAIGLVDNLGHIEVKKFILGAQSYDVFQKAINEVLASRSAS